MVGSFPIKYVCVCFIQNSCHNHFSPQTHSVTCSNRNMKWKIRVSGLWCTAVHKRFIFFILSGNERFNKKEPVTRSEIIKFWVYFLLNHLWFARRFYGFIFWRLWWFLWNFSFIYHIILKNGSSVVSHLNLRPCLNTNISKTIKDKSLKFSLSRFTITNESKCNLGQIFKDNSQRIAY